jgi:hypothetical protein
MSTISMTSGLTRSRIIGMRSTSRAGLSPSTAIWVLMCWCQSRARLPWVQAHPMSFRELDVTHSASVGGTGVTRPHVDLKISCLHPRAACAVHRCAGGLISRCASRGLLRAVGDLVRGARSTRSRGSWQPDRKGFRRHDEVCSRIQTRRSKLSLQCRIRFNINASGTRRWSRACAGGRLCRPAWQGRRRPRRCQPQSRPRRSFRRRAGSHRAPQCDGPCPSATGCQSASNIDP